MTPAQIAELKEKLALAGGEANDGDRYAGL